MKTDLKHKSRMDQRSRRTRGWIVASFNRLLFRRGISFARVGVKEIAAVAGVGRSTFYEHFRDKAEVMSQSMSPVLEALAAIVTHPGDEVRTRMLMEHIATHRPLAHRVLTGPGGEDVIRQLTELVEGGLQSGTSQDARCGSNAMPPALVAEQIARAQMGLIQAWVRPQVEPCAPHVIASSLHRSTIALRSSLSEQGK